MASNPPSSVTRSDPIHENYYVPLKVADQIGSYLFYFVALLSLAVLVIDTSALPTFNSAMNSIFLAASLALFGLGTATRLYFAPRAEDARRQEFFATAFGVDMIDDRTVGYYNNFESDPSRKAAMQTLENSFFSKEIVRKMLRNERAVYAVYAIAWIVCVTVREAPITFVIWSAQIVFSEQIIARWLRLEWLRNRFEDSYKQLHTLFISGSKKTFRAYAMTYVSTYEATKASGGISLSTSIFEKLNPSLSQQWEIVRQRLNP